MGREDGHGASALPAAQVRSSVLPSADRIFTVISVSLSGRHACTLDALLTQIFPLSLRSMSQMLGLCATSAARSAPKRPRLAAADASVTCLASKFPGPRIVCALAGPSTVRMSPPWRVIFALSGRVLPGG